MDEDIKLPEPVAYMGTFQIAGCKPGVLAHHTHTNLEALKVSGPQGQSVQPLFTADQLRAAVMADRAAREPSEVDMDEYRAMVAAMEQINPATLPGLTVAQRCALGRFAKPTGGPAE